MANKTLFIILTFILFHSFNVYATNLVVAGFALSGDYENNPENYKYTSKLLEQEFTVDGQSVFNQSLKNLISTRNLGHEFIFNLDDQSSKQAIAFTIARENLNIEQTSEGLYRAKIRTLGQIIIFDNSSQKIDALYSFPINLIRIYDKKPSENDIYSLFFEFYFGDESFKIKEVDDKGTNKCNENLKFINYFDYLVSQIPCIDLKEKYSQRVRVKKIILSEKVSQFLKSVNYSDKAFRQEVGITVTSMLSTELKMPILPFSEGQDIYKIRTRFADRTVLNLRVPESDFDINIEIINFNKKMTDSDNVQELWIYAFQNKFKFFEPLSETVYFEDTLIGFNYKQFPKSYVNKGNDLPRYLEVMNNFYRDLALSIDALNSKGDLKDINKSSKKFLTKKEREKGDWQSGGSGFDWSSSSVLKDWYAPRSKKKYKEIKKMLVSTKEKINQCR